MEGCSGCKMKERTAGCYPFLVFKTDKILNVTDCPCSECVVKIICTTSCKIRWEYFNGYHVRRLKALENKVCLNI